MYNCLETKVLPNTIAVTVKNNIAEKYHGTKRIEVNFQ